MVLVLSSLLIRLAALVCAGVAAWRQRSWPLLPLAALAAVLAAMAAVRMTGGAERPGWVVGELLIGVALLAVTVVACLASARSRALQRREADLQALIDPDTMAFWLVAPDVRVLSCSAGFETLFGVNRAAQFADPMAWLTGVDPADRDALAETDAAVMRLASSEQRVLVRRRVLDGAEGGVIGTAFVAIVMSDPHREVRDDAALRLLDALPLMASYVDRDLRYRFVNQAYERKLGRPVEAIEGAHLRDVMGAERFDVTAPSFRAALDGEVVKGPIQNSRLAPDGEAMYRILCPDRDVDGAVRGFGALLIEHAEFKTPLDASRFDRLADAAPVMVWLADADGRCTYFNRGWLDFTGRPLETQLGHGWAEAVHVDDRHRCAEVFRGTRETGEPYEIEYRLRRADGEYRWILERGAPHASEAAAIDGYAGTCLDITDRKRTQEELLQRNELEHLLFQELDHRVRNNLSALLALVDLTQRSATDVTAFGETVRGRIRAMSAAHSLLAQSRWRFADLRRLIESLLPGETGGVVRLDGRDTLIPPRNASSLAMVLHELITNSVKYGALGTSDGRLDLSWDVVAPDDHERQVSLHWRERGGPIIETKPLPGTGTTLIEGLVRTDLRGDVNLEYPPAGAEHEITIALDD